MHFNFDEKRAAQAAAVLLRLSGGRQNYTWLLKVLYLADRESLSATGAPIAGASFCSMKNGPLASDIYDCIKRDGDHAEWARCIKKVEYDVVLIKSPGDSELSEYDIEVLTSMHEKYKHLDFKEMIKVVHTLPEWREPDQEMGPKSLPLSPESMLRGAGLSNQEVSEIEHLNGHINRVDSFLS
jgi:uncharacterized phage-associated protein